MYPTIKTVITALLGLIMPLSVCAQTADYPNKPIRLVAPFAVGGSVDILARTVADTLSKATNQPVIVENRPGASGNIGMETVAKANPDGYTLLFASTNLTLNPAVYPKVPFDPIKDFVAVTNVAYAPMILITRPDFGGDSLQSLIQYGKSNPGTLNFSSSGAGGAPHLAGEMFQILTGIKMTHIPYAGAAPAITDIVSGQVQMTFTTYISAQAMLNSGRVRGLAVASLARLKALPNIPTFKEKGFEGMEFGTMFGLIAPAGTPPTIITRLYQIIKTASENPAFQENIVKQGGYMVVNTPTEYDKYIKDDVAKWDSFIKKIGGVSQN
ncbi:MAG: tripartite tricarboxylate transporter substrate binding protein [Alcaligenaceae bacterium]